MCKHRLLSTLPFIICIIIMCMLVGINASALGGYWNPTQKRTHNVTMAIGSSAELYGLCNGDTYDDTDVSCSGGCIDYVANGNKVTVYAERLGSATLTIQTKSHSFHTEFDGLSHTTYKDDYVNIETYIITVSEKKNLSAPRLTVANAGKGVSLKWKRVKGSDSYNVYRSDSSGSKKLTTTTSAAYVDTSVLSGTKYTYSVRCTDSTGAIYWSPESKKKAITHISQPTISSMRNGVNGTHITWSESKGASKYRVFIKSGSKWKKLFDTTKTTAVHSAAKQGKKYTYTVCCLNKKKKIISSYKKSGWSHTFKKPVPKVKSAVNTTSGVTVKWGKVLGAVKYRLYYKSGNTAWKKLGDTTAVSYEFKKAASGVTYDYTVRCMDATGKKGTSAYDKVGYRARFIKAPTGIKLTAARDSNCITVSWEKSNGAANYRVYRLKGGEWESIGTTDTLFFEDRKVESNEDYTYTVRCVSADLQTGISAYNPKGVTVTAPAWVTGVSIDKVDICIAPDDVSYISAKVTPSNAFDKNVTWSSSNPSVAQASNGYLWGVGRGTATITATAHNGLTASVTVTVREKINVTELVSDMLIKDSEGNFYSLEDFNTKNTKTGIGKAVIAKQVYMPVTPAEGEDHLVVRDGSYWAVNSSGELYAWGMNPNGILGVGRTGDVSSPVKILDDVKSVYSSGQLCAAVKNNGDMYIWGYDLSCSPFYPEYITSPVYKLGDIKKASMGRTHYAALTTSGYLYMWGTNYDYEIKRTNKYTPEFTNPTYINSEVKDIALGTRGSAYVKSDKVYFTGTFDSGDGIDVKETGTVLSDVVSINSNNIYNFTAITKSGELYNWGLCDGYESTSIHSPEKIASNVKQAIPGKYRSMYLDKYNSLYIRDEDKTVAIELYK